MLSPDWLFTDPVPPRTKGWTPRAARGVSLKTAYMAPERMGAGANVFDAGSAGPPDEAPEELPAIQRVYAPTAYTPPPPAEADPGPPREAEPAPPATVRTRPASRGGPADVAYIPPAPRTPRPQDVQPIPPSPGPVGYDPSQYTPIRSTVSVSGAQDVGGDWDSGLSMIGNIAQQSGFDDEGTMVAQAIARTEGGLFGAEGDKSGGGSYGPYQFYAGGQLPNYAAARGMTMGQAARYAEEHPEDAAQWALNGYLGNAIRKGQSLGLHGADLATYAQQHGQVSQSPERAGQWFNALFSGRQGPITQSASRPVPGGRPSQFGDPELSAAEAQAACGPAAAVAFARAFGRNPTLREATDLAKRFGWTTGTGMRGPESEVQLMRSMGVSAHAAPAEQRSVANWVRQGKPVSISTGMHYFVLDDYDPSTGKFHVGTSGTDLRGGSEWMTLDGMDAISRAHGTDGIQAAIFADVDSPGPNVSTGAGPSRPSPDRQEEQQRQSNIPENANATDWFSYVDSGQEVMKITWDNGQTTYHVMGPATTGDTTPGTVLATGTLGVGAGANVLDSGSGDDDTEWPIPTSTSADSGSTSIPAPVPADREERSRRSEPSSAPLPPSPPPTASEQTEWHLPDVGQAARSVLSGASGIIGGARQAVEQTATGAVQRFQAASQPSMADVPPEDQPQVAALQDWQSSIQLPDITDSPLLKPPAEEVQTTGPIPSRPSPDRQEEEGPPRPGTSPFARMARGESLTGAEQIAAVPEWVGRTGGAREEAVGRAIGPLATTPGATGAIAGAMSPEQWFPVEEVAAPVVKAVAPYVRRAAGEAAGAVKDIVPGAVGEAVRDVKDLWDPATHAFQRSWDKLAPDVLPPARAPAQAAVRPAITVAGGTAGAVQKALTTDPNDPNYLPAVAAAGMGAGLITGAAVYGGPEVYGFLRDHLAPTEAIKNRGVATSVDVRAGKINGAKGARWLYENWIEQVLGKPGKGNNTLTFLQYIEENGHAPPGSSPEVHNLVDALIQYTRDTGDEGRRLGYIRGDITTRPDSRGVTLQAYMPRVLEDHLNAAQQAPGVWTGKLNPRDNYTHMRQHVSLHDGISAGVNYANSISQAFGHYAEHVQSSHANALFIKDLKRLAPGAVQRIPKIAGTNARALNAIPKGWIPGGKYLRQWQNVAFAPELDTVLRNITERSAMDPRFERWKALMSAGKHAILAPSLYHLVNEERQVIGAAGAKGLPTVGKSIVYTLFPGMERKFWTEPQTMAEAKRAMDAGLVLLKRLPDAGPVTLGTRAAMTGFAAATSGVKSYMDERADPTKTEQQRIEDALKASGWGALGGAASSTLSKRLWETSVPFLKFRTWQLLEQSMGEREAARYVNNTFGGLNLDAIARSRRVQDVLRLGVFAPDWTESWIRQAGTFFMPGPRGTSIASGVRHSVPLPGVGASPRNVAEASRQFWLRSAALGAFTLEGLNLALNGHFTDKNGPGNEWLLETTGLYDMDKPGWMGGKWDRRDPKTGAPARMYEDILTVFRGLLNAPIDPGKFIGGRQSLALGMVEPLISGKDWRGQPIAPRGANPLEQAEWRVAYDLGRLAPSGPSEITREFGRGTGAPGLYTALGSFAGFRETSVSPLQQAIRDREQRYTSAGISQEQQQDIRTVYSGQVREAERRTADLFANPGDKTHRDIANDVRNVDWPTLQGTVKPFEPPDIASDPVAHADWIAKIQGIQSYGGDAESPAPADIDWSALPITPDLVRDTYYAAPPGMTQEQYQRLPQDGRDRLSEQALVGLAMQHDVDVDSLRDSLKARERGITDLPRLTGVTSGQLNSWVAGYRAITDDDPQVQAEKRREYIDQIHQQYNQDPAALYERIKLRGLPLGHEDPNEPGISPEERARRDLQTSYERAQDTLHNSRDPDKYPKYANPDGTPYKGSGPEQWKAFDEQVAADTKATRKTHTPEVKALIDAKEAGDAHRLKDIYSDKQANLDYQRWFGAGRNMDERHWQEYVNGTGRQFVDIQDPTENRRRTRTLELWRASTPQERQQPGKVKIKVVVNGQVREETTSLDLARKHIERAVDPKWKTALGLDSPGTDVQQ